MTISKAIYSLLYQAHLHLQLSGPMDCILEYLPIGNIYSSSLSSSKQNKTKQKCITRSNRTEGWNTFH